MIYEGFVTKIEDEWILVDIKEESTGGYFKKYFKVEGILQ